MEANCLALAMLGVSPIIGTTGYGNLVRKEKSVHIASA
jgi:hypothetical protein